MTLSRAVLSSGALTRQRALESWWQGLSEFDRDGAREVAHAQAYLTPALFAQLVEAGVLAVTEEVRTSARTGATTFRIPADILAYVLNRPRGATMPTDGIGL